MFAVADSITRPLIDDDRVDDVVGGAEEDMSIWLAEEPICTNDG